MTQKKAKKLGTKGLIYKVQTLLRAIGIVPEGRIRKGGGKRTGNADSSVTPHRYRIRAAQKRKALADFRQEVTGKSNCGGKEILKGKTKKNGKKVKKIRGDQLRKWAKPNRTAKKGKDRVKKKSHRLESKQGGPNTAEKCGSLQNNWGTNPRG